MPHKAGNGAIMGIVSEDGLPSAKRIVLMDRSNLSIVAKTVADSEGGYVFSGLNADTDDYLVFSVDDDEPTKKAIIYDRVKPILAHQGGLYWANWYLLSMAKEPLVQMLGITDNANPTNFVMTGGAGRNYWDSLGTGLVVNNPTLTIGSASLPAVKLNNSALGRNTFNQKDILRSQTKNAVSCEWVLDLSTVKQDISASLVRYNTDRDYWTGESSYAVGVLILVYAPASNKVTMFRSDGGADYNYARVKEWSIALCCEYIFPEALKDKVVHLAASILYGDNAVLYVNGKKVVTANLAGTNLKAGDYGHGRLAGIIGSTSKTGGSQLLGYPATFTTGVVAFYSSEMSEIEANASYQALFTDTLPQATGYIKAVVADYPSYLYRLNEPEEELVVKDRLRPYALGNGHELTKVGGSKIQASTDSLIKGGGGTIFGGGACRTSWLFGSMQSPRYVSVEFIAKPTFSTVSNWEMLISHGNDSTYYLEVRRHNTTGKWCVMSRENGGEVLTNFTTPIDITVMHHYAFTLNKEEGKARLYIDGVLIETQEMNKFKFDTLWSATSWAELLCIGGRVDGGMTSVSYPYYGYLAEVALYPYELSQNQIQAHYDARLTI